LWHDRNGYVVVVVIEVVQVVLVVVVVVLLVVSLLLTPTISNSEGFKIKSITVSKSVTLGHAVEDIVAR